MIKKKVSLFITLFCLLNMLSTNAQQKKLSAFLSSTPTAALYEFMKSDVDTLVIDKKEMPWILEPIIFREVHNKVILFEFGVEIVAKENAFNKKTDGLWNFYDCTNVKISGNNSVMRMNKKEYVEGEWRHVIRLRGCENIIISDLTLRDSGGDGIAIGRSKKVCYSQNIRLSNLQCINNKRQGISITSAENVWVIDSCFADTIGTAPGAGVDLEPNVPEESMININFKNCVFKNNYFAGITLSLGKLTSASKPISIVFENCLITNNFSIENDRIPAEIVIRSHRIDPVKGDVIFKSSTIENSQWSMLYARKNEAGFQVSIENCVARNICNNENCYGGIYMEVPHYSQSSHFGGFHFENLKLAYSTAKPPILVRGSKRNPSNTFKNVSGTIFLENPNSSVNPEIEFISYLPMMHKDVRLIVEKIKN